MKDWWKQVSSVIESENVGPRNLCKGCLRGGPDYGRAAFNYGAVAADNLPSLFT